MLRQQQKIAAWKLQGTFLRQARPKVLVCEWCRERPGTAVGILPPAHVLGKFSASRNQVPFMCSCLGSCRQRAPVVLCSLRNIQAPAFWGLPQKADNFTWQDSLTLFIAGNPQLYLVLPLLRVPAPPFGLICINQVLFSKLWPHWVLMVQNWDLKLHIHPSEFLSPWMNRINKKNPSSYSL